MIRNSISEKSIPISVSLTSTLEAENIYPRHTQSKQRIVIISLLAVGIAVLTSCIAKLLVLLINLVTNISFHGSFSTAHASPLGSTLGAWVIVVPVAGGIIVGLMALYGSKAIRGHGIPEAMEQILINKSRIKPAVTYLKPLSSAIAIGTGGPFGAEGPIIATGGALGSTIGQLLKITHNERKILLTAGATAGMSAIFGSPVAAIFLAIELLLFEFSPRAIIPVALACITGAAGHYFLFEQGPVFQIAVNIPAAGIPALIGYSVIGITIGLIAVFVTRAVYFIEDMFEKIPVHWMWWPAIGGVAVGVAGYFNPLTLGVGYENITNIISGSLGIRVVLSLCLLKFISWAIALGSGTSGGTLAPLLTIGAATGLLLSAILIYFFPHSGINPSLAALVGMSAMFSGASRALLTSVMFALETTGQPAALLPLLASCTGSYVVSFFLMKNTIMTEKIGRRGVKTPDSYEPDILERKTVEEVIQDDATILSEENTIGEVRNWIRNEEAYSNNYFVVVSKEDTFSGIINSSDLLSHNRMENDPISSLVIPKNISVYIDSSLKNAVEKMAREQVDVLPVVSKENNIIGVLSYKDIITAYQHGAEDHEKRHPHISLKNRGFRILVHGQRLISIVRRKK